MFHNVSADKLVKSPNSFHTHTHKCPYYLIMFGAEWRYVWVSYKACRPVQWTWDMRFASLEISNVIKNIQQDLEVCRWKSFTFMIFLPNRLHWKYTCAIIQFEWHILLREVDGKWKCAIKGELKRFFFYRLKIFIGPKLRQVLLRTCVFLRHPYISRVSSLSGACANGSHTEQVQSTGWSQFFIV